MAIRDLRVTLLGEDRTGSAFGSATHNAENFGGTIGKIGKGMALAFGGVAVAGVAGFGAALFQGAKDAASYQVITNQVAQTIKSTGAAAGVSVDDLKAYAGQLESQSGIDEEVILSGQNVLLTFTNIRNGVGKGKDMFNQASQAALDMATTMGGDLVGASVLVGKALNDPIKGVGALSKAGVQLSEAQKATIKTMAEHNNIAGAQAIILKELTTQFGGAAAAAGAGLTGSLARAKDAFSDIMRTVGEKLLPVLSQAGEFFASHLPGAFEVASNFISSRVMPVLHALGDFWTANGPAIVGAVRGVVDGIVSAFRGVAEWASDKLPAAFAIVQTFIADRVVPAFNSLSNFWTTNGPTIIGVVRTLGDVMVAVFMAAGNAVNTVTGFFMTHRGAAEALGAAVGVVAALVVAAWASQVVAATTGAIASARAWFSVALGSGEAAAATGLSTAQIVVGWMAMAAQATINAAIVVAGWVVMGVQAMASAARMAAAWLIALGPIGIVIAIVIGIVALVVANWDTIRNATVAAWGAVAGAVSSTWDWIKGAVSSAIGFIVDIFLNFTGPGLIIKHWETIRNVTVGAWNAVSGAVSGGIDAVVSFISGLPGRIMDAVSGFGRLLVDTGANVVGGLIQGIRAMGSKVKDVLLDLLPGPLRGFANALGIQSPSTVFAGFGRNIGQGLVNGIEGMKPAVLAQMTGMAGLISGQSLTMPTLQGGGAAGGGSVGASAFAQARSQQGAAIVTSDGALLGRIDALLASNRRLEVVLAAMPRDYQLGQRAGVGVR